MKLREMTLVSEFQARKRQGATDKEICRKHRERIQNMLISTARHSNAVCIMANPEVGVSSILRELPATASEYEMDASYRSLENESSRTVMAAINRIARSLCDKKASGPQILVLDELPSLFPSDYERFGKTMRLLFRHSVRVICALQTNNLQVQEMLPGCAVLEARDICFDKRDEKFWNGHMPYKRALDLSHGLPRLIHRLSGCGIDPDGTLGDQDAKTYAADLDEAVMHILSSLDSKKAQLLTTMLLLGGGSNEEVQDICSMDAKHDLQQLSMCVPLVDIGEDSFSCGCAADLRMLYGMERFSDYLAVVKQAVKGRIMEALEAKGDFGRAGFVLEHMKKTKSAARGIICNAPGYLEAGQTDSVAWALSETDRSRGLRAQKSLARSGYHLVYSARSEAFKVCQQIPECGDAGEAERILDALYCFRMSLGSDDCGAAEAASCLPGSSILMHCRCWNALLAGDRESMDALMKSLKSSPSISVLPEVLAADCAFFREFLMNKGAVWPRVSHDRHDVLALWMRTLRTAAETILHGGRERDEIALLVDYWNDREDPLPRLIVNLCACVAALRDGSAAHAHVALKYAGSAAAELPPNTLSDAASMLRSLAVDNEAANQGCLSKRMGTEGAFVLASFMDSALMGEQSGQEGALPRMLPPQMRWLLGVLLEQLGDLSGKLDAALPQSWRTDMKEWRRNPSEDMKGTDGRVAEGKKQASPKDPQLLEISLLGHFEVKVDGEPILINHWPRHSSKALLQMLAAKKGHTLRRVDVLNAIWPEVDYVEGRPRIYSAVSTLRNVVRQKGTKARFVLGGDGMISLNPSSVVCDVDRFEALAKKTMQEGVDTQSALDAASEICDIYQGEMIVSPLDSSGMMARRAEELRHEYVDAMTSAAQLALEVGSLSAAALYARNANRELPTREDAVIVLLQVYLRQGRTSEAWRAYRDFSQHLLDAQGLHPSSRLRAVMGQVWDDTKGAGDAVEPADAPQIG